MASGSARNMEIVNSFMQRVHGFAALVSCSLQEASLASCNMVNTFEWACYAHMLTEGVEESGSEDHNVMQNKMREMGKRMGLPCPLDLQFLRMGMDHVIETMVLNPTLTEDMLLEMVQKVNNYSTRVRISTPLRKLKEAKEVRKYCQSTEVLVQALESQLKNKYAAMPFPKYEHDLCNHLRMLLENLALWMQASHGSVWFKYRLEGVIASISQCPHGWSVLVSFFNTNLGQVERSMRPVVSQTLELIHGWMARQYGVKQTSCGVWTVSPQLMAQAAENHKVFREWYLKILEEFGDRMQADADTSELPFESESVPSTLLFDFELCSLSGMNCPGRVDTNTNTSNSRTASVSFMGNGSNQSEYRQLSKAVTELLCRDSQTKGLVFNLLNSKHEGRVLSVWAKLKREMVDRFSS